MLPTWDRGRLLRAAWSLAACVILGLLAVGADSFGADMSWTTPLAQVAPAAPSGAAAPAESSRSYTVDIFILLILVAGAMAAVCRSSRRA